MIEHTDLTTKVYRWLQGRILHHAYLPGAKLDVHQLAADLGVSRTPVKDAINRLVTEGLVVLQSRKGTYVAELTPTTLHALIEARLMIETWAVRHATPAALDRAAGVVTTLLADDARLLAADSTQFDQGAGAANNRALHTQIVMLADNPELLRMHLPVLVRMEAGRIYPSDDEARHRRAIAAHPDHLRIRDALLHRDIPALLDAVAADIGASEQHTLSLLEQYTRTERDEWAAELVSNAAG